ncbi:MAG: Mur ligase family protein [Pseudomonadota bacterium]
MPAILTFPLYGPSRRASVPVIEVRLDPSDPQFPSQCPSLQQLNDRLVQHTLDPLQLASNEATALDEWPDRFCILLARLAMALQQNAGHAVELFSAQPRRFKPHQWLVLVEHAHAEVGMAAVQLAALLLGSQHKQFATPFAQFMGFAQSKAPSRMTLALAQVARQRSIPVAFPGRPPMDTMINVPSSTGSVNLLQLGHGTHRRWIQADDVRLDDVHSSAEQSAAAYLDLAWPDPERRRVPIVAVTGTNGKTTTTRMVAHILHEAGFTTGLVTSEGIQIGDQRISEGDSGSFMGHSRVLADTAVQAAALETHHRGIVVRGFAFDDCDVAVCLNVTPDHLARGEIETLQEMADVKAALPLHTTQTAVLFADDEDCRAMAQDLSARSLCWVSMMHSKDELADWPGPKETASCTLAEYQGEEWIEYSQNGQSVRLLRVEDLPASFNGAARFMISNAMHAAAATLALNIHPDRVASALSSFVASDAMTPGRLNEVSGLPFRLFLDFAHNPDGIEKLAEFTDRLEVDGRKMIALSGMGKRDDEVNRMAAAAAAGHYDHYFLKDYTPSTPPLQKVMAPFMRRSLIEAGVEPAATTLLTYGKQVLFDILDQCSEGDLLVYLIGNAEKQVIGQHIAEYRHRLKPGAAE